MLTIGQVASRAGLRASAIRYYEARGLLPIASRKAGKRMYDASIIERLAVIELAKVAGFDLEEIREMLSRVGEDQPAPAWRKLAQMKNVEIDEEIRKLEWMKYALNYLYLLRRPSFGTLRANAFSLDGEHRAREGSSADGKSRQRH